MSSRSTFVGSGALAIALVGFTLRAVTVHSVGAIPIIHRVTTVNNDLDGVVGQGPPGRVVQLWYKQRSFREGKASGSDRFGWCAWKHGGQAIFLGQTAPDAQGIWRFSGLRDIGNTVQLFPPGPAEDTCESGLYTELLPRACDPNGTNCTAFNTPKLHWLNVRRLTATTGVANGAIEFARTAAITVADGPNDGPEPTDVSDVDLNAVDTTRPGWIEGERVSWICGSGGNAPCPTIAIHDSSTIVEPDPEFPFVLGMIHAHREGGTFIAAAEIPRPDDLGFTVNVNARFRGDVDIDLGCDPPKFTDFFSF